MVRVAEGMVTVELGEATAAVATLVGAAERGLARLIGDPGRAPSPVSGDPSRETAPLAGSSGPEPAPPSGGLRREMAPLGGSPRLGIARLGDGSGPEVTGRRSELGPEGARVGGRRGAGLTQPRRGPAWADAPEGDWSDALGPGWEVERITVRLVRLEPDSGEQLGLFAVDPGRRRELDAALATIRRRFGEAAVRRVSGVKC